MRVLALTSSCTLAILVVVLSACSGPASVADPLKTLQTPERPGREYLAAMQAADRNPNDPAYRAALKRIITAPNYVVDARRAAYARLYEIDRASLANVLELNLPKLEMLEWRRELCERIAKDDWKDVTPTLIRASAQPVPGWADLKKDRPERLAIVAMYGDDRVVDVLFDALAKANPITQANLRARCWELLLLEGQEARLRALLADEGSIRNDGMLLDLRAGVVELGVLPRNRDEITWLRWLRSAPNKDLWSAAAAAAATLPSARREALEVRDIPMLVAVAKHRPELLTLTDLQLDAAIVAETGGDGRKVYTPDFQGHDGGNPDMFSERFAAAREKLSWGDRLAMMLAIEALKSPELRAHIFACADRDIADKGTEYGGMIDLDSQGRFELVEFPSRTRGNDKRYEAPQQLMDALYGGLFHVHMHAQSYDNERYAGPHMGDFMFAEATRANCLVFSFVKRDALNVDFYRYGRVVVDLGTLPRP